MGFSLTMALERMKVLLSGPSAGLDSEMGDLLEEFEAVMEEMSAPSVPVLSQEKERPAFSDGVTDSGIEDTDDGECFSPLSPSLSYTKPYKDLHSV